MEFTREFPVDLNASENCKNISVKQFDNLSRILTVKLQEDGKNVSIPSDATIVCRMQRPDGIILNHACTFAGNLITVNLPGDALEVDGTLLLDFLITQGTVTISTTNIYLNIVPSPHGNTYMEEAESKIVNITATASVDQLTGRAGCRVSKTIGDNDINFDFAFTGLKGEKGDVMFATFSINSEGHLLETYDDDMTGTEFSLSNGHLMLTI